MLISRRGIIAATLAAPGTMSAAVAGVPGAALAIESRRGEPVHVTAPIRTTYGTPWTAGSINGSRPYPLALNIQFRFEQISPALARELNLPAGSGTQSLFRYDSLVLAGSAAAGPGQLIVREDQYDGRPTPGSIGRRRFNLPFELDWDAGRLSFYDREWRRFSPQPFNLPPPGSTRLRTQHRMDRGAWPIIEAQLDGQPVVLGVITEIPYALHLLPRAFDRFWDRWSRRRDDPGEDGSVYARLAVSPMLSFPAQNGEPLVLRDVLVRMNRGLDAYDAHWNRGESDGIDGYVGFDVVRRFNLFASEAEETMWLRPSRQHDEPYADDRAGVTLAMRPDPVLTRVDPVGPAYRAGLRQGDYITGYAGEGGLAGLGWALTRPAGSVVEVTYQRGIQADQHARIVLEDRV